MRNSNEHIGLARQIEAVRAGDEKAFTRLVLAYQQLAYASAVSILGDYDLARDAVQESFIAVYYKLYKLENVESFPAWLYSIVRHSCYRILRRQKSLQNRIENMPEKYQSDPCPDHLLEQKEMRQEILDALDDLPHELRMAVHLFYIEEHSQQEVADFLGVRKSTINNRLHSARKKLKRRLFEMVKDNLKSSRLPDDFADDIAKIIRVQGPVIEAQLASGSASSLFDTWTSGQGKQAQSRKFTIIQRDIRGRIRLIGESDSESVKIGSKISIHDEGPPPIQNDESLTGAIAAIAPPKNEPVKISETGIKIVDLMAPLPQTGTVGFFGVQGVGRAILVMELYHRLKNNSGKLAMFYFVSAEEAVTLRAVVEREPNFPPDASGPLETAWLVTKNAADPEYPATNESLDSGIYFSPLISCKDRYPAIDCLHSSSRLISDEIAGKDHLETVHRIRSLVITARQISHDPQFHEYVANGAYSRARKYFHGSPAFDSGRLSSDDRQILSRARKLELFFTQPFYVAEPFTGKPGATVSLADTIRGCKAILDGDADNIAEELFAFTGSFDDIVSRTAG